MAKMIESGAWIYNRHDRRRGTQPPDCICRNRECGVNLHDVGVHTYEGGSGHFAGRYQPGASEGGVIIEVLQYTDYHADILCIECHTAQPQLHLEGFEFDPNSLTDREVCDVDDGLASEEVQRRYTALSLYP